MRELLKGVSLIPATVLSKLLFLGCLWQGKSSPPSSTLQLPYSLCLANFQVIDGWVVSVTEAVSVASEA